MQRLPSRLLPAYPVVWISPGRARSESHILKLSEQRGAFEVIGQTAWSKPLNKGPSPLKNSSRPPPRLCSCSRIFSRLFEQANRCPLLEKTDYGLWNWLRPVIRQPRANSRSLGGNTLQRVRTSHPACSFAIHHKPCEWNALVHERPHRLYEKAQQSTSNLCESH